MPQGGYQPFPIADFTAGIHRAKQPWLTPENAWRNLDNCYVRNGRVIKRGGVQRLGRLGIHLETQSRGTSTDANILNSFSGGAATALDVPVLVDHYDDEGFETLRIVCSPWTFKVDTSVAPWYHDGSWKVAMIDTAGTADYVGGASATGARFLKLSTGEFFFWMDSGSEFDSAAEPCSATYHRYDGDTVMGVFQNELSSTTKDLIVADTKRLYRFNTALSRFDQIDNTGSGGDGIFFTGDDLNFPHAATFGDDMFICNMDADHPLKIPTSFTVVDATTGSGGDEIQYAWFVFSWKGRLWYFRTAEGATPGGATWYHQRARFSEVNQPESFLAADYVDAPTSERLISVTRFRDDLICLFENSVWKIRETGDYRIPFTFDRISELMGSSAPMGTAVANDEAVALGQFGFVATDANDVVRVDDPIPDWFAQLDPSWTEYSYGVTLDALNQWFLSYVEDGDIEAKPNDVLVANFKNGSFAHYTYPSPHCFGMWTGESSLTWDDLTGTWDTEETIWDSAVISAGFPTVLFGDRGSSSVFQIQTGLSDNGVDIEMSAKTGRLNPFKVVGARFGYCDFQFDANPGVSVTVKFFKDFNEAAYKTETLDLTPKLGETKVRRRVFVNKTAELHQIEVADTSASSFALDYIIPYFKPARRLAGAKP
jgi:hypothetical protein